MSRRNPLNDRYLMEKDKQGVSRKSVSNVKPKMQAGESTTGTAGTKKKSGLSGGINRAREGKRGAKGERVWASV